MMLLFKRSKKKKEFIIVYDYDEESLRMRYIYIKKYKHNSFNKINNFFFSVFMYFKYVLQIKFKLIR